MKLIRSLKWVEYRKYIKLKRKLLYVTERGSTKLKPSCLFLNFSRSPLFHFPIPKKMTPRMWLWIRVILLTNEDALDCCELSAVLYDFRVLQLFGLICLLSTDVILYLSQILTLQLLLMFMHVWLQGHNIVLMSNHQTEADPAVIALLLEATNPSIAENMVNLSFYSELIQKTCLH